MTVAHAGPAGRHELAAVELQPEDAHVLRLRPERRHRQHGDTERRRRSPASRRTGSAARSTSTAASARTSASSRPIDATTGKIVWQKQLAGVVLRGLDDDRGQRRLHRPQRRRAEGVRRDGRQQLWSSRPAPAPTTRRRSSEHNGKEYVAFYAGGNALAASPHGDNLWLLRLDGKLGPAPAPGAGAGVEHAGEDDAAGRPTSAERAPRRRGGRQGGVLRQLLELPRRRGHGRQRRPRPDGDPGREQTCSTSSIRSRTAAAACRRSRARCAEADPGRRGLRHDQDHQQISAKEPRLSRRTRAASAAYGRDPHQNASRRRRCPRSRKRRPGRDSFAARVEDARYLATSCCSA